MANKPRSGLAGWQKALLWAVGFFVLWQVATTDTIGNGLLGFFLGGEVPGTNIVLPPEAILMGSLAVVVLIAFVVVVRMWAGHRRVRKFRAELTESVATDDSKIESKPDAEPKPAMVVAATAEPVKTPKQRRIGPAFAVAATKTRLMSQHILQRLGPWSQKAARGAKKAGGRFAVHAIGAYELLRMATIFCAKWLQQHSMTLAKWVGRWCKATAKKLRDWLRYAGTSLRPFVKELARKVALAWEGTVQWLRRLSQNVIRHAKRVANSIKQTVRKSPLPGWVAGAQQKFRSPDQPDK